METTGLQGPRIALLIDFDNVVLGVDDPPGFDIELVVNALRSRGIVVLGRAYGDWYRHSRHRRKLMEQGIELVETPAFGPIIKNSADIRIALDGLEIGMTQHHINEFCLVSGDSDFLPLIKRLQYLGKTVVVISGTKFTADLVRKNCNEFISYENLLAESVGATEDATTLEGAFVLLARTINTLHERGMEVRSSTVKQMMLQLNPVFSERNFGCSQFKQFLDKGCRAGIIKLGRRDPNSGEFTVLLPSDFDDEIVEEAPPIEVVEPRKLRARTPRVQQADEDLGLRELTSEAESSEAPAAEEAGETPGTPAAGGSDANVASRALRRGRLRFSGKTWKGASRSVLQNTSGDETIEDATSEAISEAESTPIESTPETEEAAPPIPAQIVEAAPALEESQSDEAPAPETSSKQAESAPAEAEAEDTPVARKRGARGGRRRKAATKSARSDNDSEDVGAQNADTFEPAASESATYESQSTPEAPAPEQIETPSVEAAPESEAAPEDAASETAKPKAAAKKATRRRRAPAKKKAE